MVDPKKMNASDGIAATVGQHMANATEMLTGGDVEAAIKQVRAAARMSVELSGALLDLALDLNACLPHPSD